MTKYKGTNHVVSLAAIERILENHGPMTTVELWLKVETMPHNIITADVNRLRQDLNHFWRTFSISFAGGKWWTIKQWSAHILANRPDEHKEEHWYA